MSDDFARWLQSRLTSHGFPVGVIDGQLGPVTKAALRAFQTTRGLFVTGTATAETVNALRATSTGGTPRPDGLVRPIARPAPAWPRESEVSAFYGPVGQGQGKLTLPYPMRLAWDRSVVVTAMTLHAKVIESAGRAFEAIALAYAPAQRVDLGLDIFGGSLNVRKKRGGSSWSMHSWGIAIDFDPERNQLTWGRGKARLAQPDAEAFWAAWEAEGWTSLGRTRDMDFMHIQAARL